MNEINEINDTKVVIILFQYSVVAKGIEKKLADVGFDVTTIVDDLEKVELYAKEPSVFLVYLPDEIASDKAELVVLKGICDVIGNNGRRMICIGEKRYHAELSANVGKINNYTWIDRPVDMAVLTAAIKDEVGASNKPMVKGKILIVDDDPSYAKMVREWIKDFYNVGVVTAGMQAITYLMKNKVDLILLDYEMPIVDGPQVFQMLKSEPELENIPVVFLTGVGTREGVARVMELKPNGYILKSTTRENLLKSLKAQFAKMQ